MSGLLGVETHKSDTEKVPEGKFKTGVTGVFADDQVARGTDKFPVFNVSQKEFNSNLTADRRRMRFSSGSTVQGYMQGTNYTRPFYVQYSDEKSGKTYRRKVG